MLDYQKEIERKAQPNDDTMQSRLNVAFSNILKTSDGRKVLKTILTMYPLVNDTFSTDALQMAFNCGRKSIVLELTDFIKVNFGNDIFTSIDKEEI